MTYTKILAAIIYTKVLAELHPESCVHFTPALPADKAAAIKRPRFLGSTEVV